MLSEIVILSLSVITLHLISNKYNMVDRYLNLTRRPTVGYCQFCVSFWLGLLLLVPLELYIQGSLEYEILIVLWAQPSLTSFFMGAIDS